MNLNTSFRRFSSLETQAATAPCLSASMRLRSRFRAGDNALHNVPKS